MTPGNAVLKKYVSGNFYTNNDFEFNFTPLNWYFIGKIKDIYAIFKEITKVRFPKFLEYFVNDKWYKDFMKQMFDKYNKIK